MTEKNGVGVTVVSHDNENRAQVDWFKGAGGFYLRDVTYHETSLLQLASLTASSAHCEQFIMYECYATALLLNGVDGIFGWWVSRDGRKMKYWGGADSVDYRCACALTKTCADKKIRLQLRQRRPNLAKR